MFATFSTRQVLFRAHRFVFQPKAAIELTGRCENSSLSKETSLFEVGILIRNHDCRKIFMQIPLQLAFEGMDPSEAVRVAIEHEVDRLEQHSHHIIGCRVAVIAPSHKHRHGSGFHVHISVTIPPHENIIVNHAPSDDNQFEHIEVAVKDAFASARRQLADLAKQC